MDGLDHRRVQEAFHLVSAVDAMEGPVLEVYLAPLLRAWTSEIQVRHMKPESDLLTY